MSSQPTVFLVDDDDGVRDSLTLSLTKSGLLVEAFASAEAFLEAVDPSRAGCLVLDVRMPAGMNGPDLQEALQDKGWSIPIIFLSGHGSVPLSVQTVKRGALNFLEKPFKLGELTEQIALAFEQDSEQRSRLESQHQTLTGFARLTVREKEVTEFIVAGRSSKEIARELGISHRTIDVHRARILEKMDAANVPELIAKVLGAELFKKRPD